jgi:chemotaxis protein methyltransferase CheR
MQELDLDGYSTYQAYLKTHPEEWQVLDGLCIITISRFYRDHGVFRALEEKILPALAASANAAGRPLRGWSAGCASGEEPYTLAILWEASLSGKFPQGDFHITATDLDAHLLERARKGCYTAGSMKELPQPWQQRAFTRQGELLCIRAEYKNQVHFMQQDIRQQMPEGVYDLILCRNLIGFYYDKALQTELFQKIHAHLHPGGALVLGTHETLPDDTKGFRPWLENEPIYIRV